MTAALFTALAFLWTHGTGDETLAARFAAPAGFTRLAVATDSFGAWLRGLPLLPAGAPVHLYDGSLKARQDVHAAVIDLDVGTRDLQQCADAVMRLRAEWLYARGLTILFHPDPGQPRALTFDARTHDRRSFEKYLVRLFADAGSASLAAELHPIAVDDVQPGDVLIQGGYPGHAVLVVDVVMDGAGQRRLMLAQSYMPAQQMHILKNAATANVWFDAAALATAGGLATPEWRPFHAPDLRRF
jgi:hypothetical protein